MKIGIYAPYMEAYGGGEKYICKIAEILSKINNNDVELLVFKQPNLNKIKDKLNIDLSHVKINVFQNPTSLFLKIPVIRTIAMTYTLSNLTRKYDLFINQEHDSAIPARSKKAILICEVPPIKSTNPYKYLIAKLFCDNKLRTYDAIITNSNYTKKWLEKWYKREVKLLYPPTEQFLPLPKKNIILSVGRFFIGGHSKKQIEMIRIFKELYNNNNDLEKWEYHLIGSVKNKNQDQDYLKKCQDEAKFYPIYFHIDISFEDLKNYYGNSKVFWSATGLGEDETQHPDRMEHFGITTVEAMSAGCVPVAINRGGQPEIVRNRIDGFLWNTTDELKKYTVQLMSDEILWMKMSKASIERSQEFDMKRFCKNVKQIFETYETT